MEYEDRITIETPEGVPLELILAGYGSRFSSQLIDFTLKLVLIGALTLVLGIAGDLGPAIFFVMAFLVYVGYDVAFETLGSGRTPGKRGSGLRVVREGGEPVTFTVSCIRNIVRIIDGIATGYAVGTISILVSRRNQRLGDMAAGTLVVRESTAEAAAPPAVPSRPPPTPASAWDVTGVSTAELAAVRHFLDRRYELAPGSRARLARQLADGLRAKVPGARDDVPPERFLEALAVAKARRS
jgi:uncharacterized RDD family membrane protein YckC